VTGIREDDELAVTPAADGGSIPAAVGSHTMMNPGGELGESAVIAPEVHIDLNGNVGHCIRSPDSKVLIAGAADDTAAAAAVAVAADLPSHMVILSGYYHCLDKRINFSMTPPLHRFGNNFVPWLNRHSVPVFAP
jgi:hypothetical protein